MAKITKEYFDELINNYIDGKTVLKGDHPKEVEQAIDTFFKASKMLVDHPEIGTIPAEYLEKLLASLAQYPQYHELLIDLVGIIQQGDEHGS